MWCTCIKKCSAEHVLIKLIDSWKFALDENKYAGTIPMDLSNFIFLILCHMDL